jgi:hypothetical protein
MISTRWPSQRMSGVEIATRAAPPISEVSEHSEQLFCAKVHKSAKCGFSAMCNYQLEIAQLLLEDELNFLGDRGHELEPDAAVLPFIVRRGFHPKLGARPMRDTTEKLVGDAVAIDLLTSGNGLGHLSVDDVGNCLVISRRQC